MSVCVQVNGMCSIEDLTISSGTIAKARLTQYTREHVFTQFAYLFSVTETAPNGVQQYVQRNDPFYFNELCL